MIKIAINGFGRIGRSALKIALQKPELEVVAINDLTNPRILAHLLKHDSAYGTFFKDVSVEEDGKAVRVSDKGMAPDREFFAQTGRRNFLVVGGKKILILAQRDPTGLPWKQLGVDVVLECTGRFTTNAAAGQHIKAGARKVVISANAKDDVTPTILLGVNAGLDNGGGNVISNASCTTNCVSPVIAVLHSNFKVIKSAMTTVHAVTSGQNLVDGPPNPQKPDLRRARAAGWNMIPTSTGAAKATTKAIPELAGKFDGVSIRVPIITGSISDVTALVETKTSVEEVNQAFIEAKSNSWFKNVLDATYEPLVSSDIIGNPHSAIVDLSMTKVVDGDLVKVLAWYDNEWGYSNRLVEMAILAGKE